jgi:hypothetical protein
MLRTSIARQQILWDRSNAPAPWPTGSQPKRLGWWNRFARHARLARLEKEINSTITHLQFYDRMVQHLSHVQDYLSGAAGELANGADAADAQVWSALCGKLRTRLISQAQRELLDAVLPPSEGGIQANSQRARDEHAAQGTVELF